MKPKFNIFDRVCYRQKDKWIVGYISGIQAKIGYDLMLWEYTVTNTVYGDHKPESWGCRADVDTSKWLREDEVYTTESMINSRRKQLQAEKNQLEQMIKRLDAELQKI